MELTSNEKKIAMQAKSAEELFELAKGYDRPISKEEAEEIYAELNKEGELADEELEDAAGGACYSTDDHGNLIVMFFNSCRMFEPEENEKFRSGSAKNCRNCTHMWSPGTTMYCRARTRFNDPVRGKATITGPSHDYGPSGPVIQPMK